MVSPFAYLLEKLRRLDVIQLWEFSRQVLVSLSKDAPLVGAGMVAVPAPKTIDNRHAFHDFTDRSEVLIEVGIVPQVDEQLRDSRMRSRTRESDPASRVPLMLDGVVRDDFLAPGRSDYRITAHSELRDVFRHDAKESCVVVETAPYEIVETVDAKR
jgi:hypothetical protein